MKIELANAVAVLRDELLSAVARGAGEDLTFKVGPVEMEFAVELREEEKARGGIKVWLVSADAEAAAARGQTHRVKVTLTPQGPDGDLLVRGTYPRPSATGDVSGHIGR
ncbi:trypco2 family protein [Streptomyces sp. NPDC051956]|uniref:trypco2 family protein n=1 Tax=Streptomyces sp. NPDC051956 TaxID=3365677 RepID=UPI0037D2B83D